MSGWICSYRAIWQHELFKGRAERVGVWDWMLKTAVWKDTRFTSSGHSVDLKRGELCVSQRQVSDATGMSRQAFRTFISALEKEGAVQTRTLHKSTQARTIITICKYDKYQSRQTDSNPRSTQDQPTKEQGNNIPVGETDKSAPDSVVDISTPNAAVWAIGKAYLTPLVGSASAGKMIGKWLRQTQGDAVPVLAAIEAAKKSGTHEPIPYIAETLKNGEGGKSRFVSFEEQDRIRSKRIEDFYLS